MANQVKIVLITGYLGAGKTTLLNRILMNEEGLRAAVIVNDIGEVNIDASLIKNNGSVAEEELIPLTNGCICCTLRGELSEGLMRLAVTGKYDYIIIEASGICEPMPIAHTISGICDEAGRNGVSMVLDNIVAILDAGRMFDEFSGGQALLQEDIEEDDLENLMIEQIEFCNTILINKADLVTPAQMGELKTIIRALQSDAVIYETVNCEIATDKILNTGRFNLKRTMASAAWLKVANEHFDDDKDSDSHTHKEHEQHHEDDHSHGHHEHEDDHSHAHKEHEHHEHDHSHGHHEHEDDPSHAHEEHEHHEHDHSHGHHHHHHHDHDHDHSHALEYGISTFVYYRRRPLTRPAMEELTKSWFPGVIRCKGLFWYKEEPDMSYILSQSGKQITEKQGGPYLASAPEEQQKAVLARFEEIRRIWDEKYKDRMIKLVFIGKDMDREAIEAKLDSCLSE